MHENNILKALDSAISKYENKIKELEKFKTNLNELLVMRAKLINTKLREASTPHKRPLLEGSQIAEICKLLANTGALSIDGIMEKLNKEGQQQRRSITSMLGFYCRKGYLTRTARGEFITMSNATTSISKE